jgi:hypothetical protein
LFNSTGETSTRIDRTNNFRRAMALGTNLFEVRLTMRWPVYGTTNKWRVGNNKQTFRSLVNARMSVQTFNRTNLYFLNPSVYGPFIF